MGSNGEGRCGQLTQEENTADEPWRWQGEQLSDSDARVEMHSAMKYLDKKFSKVQLITLNGEGINLNSTRIAPFVRETVGCY